MTAKGGGARPACASCKYQRRKCPADCLLAPYFPADNQRQFLNCHRLFGVSNITKILKKIDRPELRDVAMKTIIYEANMRDYQRVHGCVSVIFGLHSQVQETALKLQTVLSEIAILQEQLQSMQLGSSSAEEESSLILAENSNDYHHLLFDSNNIAAAGGGDNSSVGSVENPWSSQNHHHLYDPMTMTMGIQAAVHQQFDVEGVIDQEYDEISPYFETIHEEGEGEGDVERVDESLGPNYSKNMVLAHMMQSSESTVPTMESMQCKVDFDIAENDQELKQAAASFTLTSAALKMY